MTSVLVIDDDQDIVDLVAFHLDRAGIGCETSLEGGQALELIRRQDFSVIVLDIMLPGMSGLDLLKHLKSDPTTSPIPVILLTAKTDERDRIRGLELGADDYVTKPFSPKELLLRIRRSIDRRLGGSAGRILRSESITLDPDRYHAEVSNRSIDLTRIEFELLRHLLQAKGRVLSRERLIERIWGSDYEGTTRTLDTHVQRLRSKLRDAAGSIETVRGIGYRLAARDS